ncbi:ATP11-domain-containing protein [Ascodesmis nigricans]|uniref:ATP11-domain-containing protein n=1 Tax=Ascodesmis nigricans TaxID=341454 RepID=A0A4S2MQT8_9PEZI|nr:ATP11-domain-containing protein [Ascodesmis nigricans]
MRPLLLQLQHRLAPVVRTHTRNARIVNARFFQSRVEPRVVDKYREKLEKKIKTEGVSSYDELKAVYADKIASVRKSSAASPEVEQLLSTTSPPTPSHEPFTPPPAPSPSPTTTTTTNASPASSPLAAAARSASTPPGVKTLSSFIDLSLLSQHTDPKEIETIWRLRFSSSPSSLSAAIPASTFTTMSTLARQHPMFILPLPHPTGASLHILQWTFPTLTTPTLIFTSLAEYKLRGEFAVPHTTLTHHLELAESRGVVLAQGQVMEDRGVSVEEAGLLVSWVQRFYGGVGGTEEDNARRRRLVEMFSKGDEKFSVEELLEEVERAI